MVDRCEQVRFIGIFDSRRNPEKEKDLLQTFPEELPYGRRYF